MLIWYISKYFSKPNQAVVGDRAFLLIEHLSECGYFCKVFCSSSNRLHQLKVDSGIETINKNFQISWIRGIKNKQARSCVRILGWIEFEGRVIAQALLGSEKPAVIVVSSLSFLSLATGMLLKKIYKCRLIVEIRDIWPLTLTEEGGYSDRSFSIRCLQWIERKAYESSDAIIGTMPNLKVHVAKVSAANCPVYCVPMIYRKQQTVPKIDSETRKLVNFLRELKRDYIVVGYVGSHGVTNALRTLLKAAEKLEAEPKLKFVFIGDGDEKIHLKQEFGHLHNTYFCGSIPKGSVTSVLVEFDILWFATFDSEVWDYGQSLNKVIDYMASKRPVIASYSGFASMLNEAGCGLFVPAEDVEKLVEAVIYLSNLSRMKLDELGEKGETFLLEKHSQTYVGSMLVEVITKVTSRG